MQAFFNEEVEKFFEDLVLACGISGNSSEVIERLTKRLSSPHIQILPDVGGLEIFQATVNPEAEFKVMLNAHLDAVGLRVRFMDDKGFIFMRPVGGVDLQSLKGQKVKIMTTQGPLPGVIQAMPIHHMAPKDRQSVPSIDGFYIRTEFTQGLPDQSPIRIGDPIIFDQGISKLGPDYLIGPGFDNRLGILITSEILRLLRPTDIKVGLYMVAASGEEIGCRGIRAATQKLSPDLAITVDVTNTTDYPGADKKKLGSETLRAGPVISRGFNTRTHYNETLMECAQELDIPFQIRAEDITATDGREIDEAGVPTLVVRCPGSMLHTPNDLLCRQDIEWTANLLLEFIKRLPN